MEDSVPTRGERNKNPGNLDRAGTQWLGMSADQSGDSRFIVFDDATHGIRALMRVLLSYQRRDGINTVRGIVDRWAPAIENDTPAYIGDMVRETGFAADDILDFTDLATIQALARGLIHHENGRVVYSDQTIADASILALA